MTAEKILQSDVLDILFEGRNKLYGAYELRRTYHRRIKRGLGGMIFTIAALTGSYYLSFGNQNSSLAIIDVYDTVNISKLADPEKPRNPEPPPQPPRQEPVQATAALTAPLIVAELPETKMPDQRQLDTSLIGSVTSPGIASDGLLKPPLPDGQPGGTGATIIAPPTQPTLPPPGPVDMNGVDEQPQYPGGPIALVNYMVRNLNSELDPGVKYVVRAQFIIDEEGSVSDAIILHSDDENLNGQVLKALRKMKPWKPGMLHGKKVAVRFTMPVTFVGAEE